jgi:hypothetical protein
LLILVNFRARVRIRIPNTDPDPGQPNTCGCMRIRIHYTVLKNCCCLLRLFEQTFFFVYFVHFLFIHLFLNIFFGPRPFPHNCRLSVRYRTSKGSRARIRTRFCPEACGYKVPVILRVAKVLADCSYFISKQTLIQAFRLGPDCD